MTILTNLAQTPTSGNIFEALGIDWKMLIFQILGFVVLVWVLGKFVYPILMKTVDERQAAIEAGTKAAAEAEEKAEAAKASIDKLMKQARKDASDIVSTAKEEATAAIDAATAKSKQQAERIVAEAHDQIGKDVLAAKKALHNETLDLVALATEKVVEGVVDESVDRKLVARAVKEAQ